MTETGPSAVDKFLGVWLDYERIKADVDLERLNQANNMPDFVDTQHGVTTPGAPAMLTPMQWALLGLAGLAMVFVVAKVAR